MIMKKTRKILVLIMAATAFAACSDDLGNGGKRIDGALYFDVSQKTTWLEGTTRSGVEAPIRMQSSVEGQPIYLHTHIEPTITHAENEEVLTRGDRHRGDVFSPTGTARYNFGVYGKVEDQSSPLLNYETIITTYNENADYQWYIKDYDFESGGWPEGKTGDFYGYAPANTNSNLTCGLQITTGNDGVPVLYYTAPSDVNNQLDVLTAYHLDVPKDNDVELEFEHVMASVKFAMAATNNGFVWHEDLNNSQTNNYYYVTVNSITVSGVYDTGNRALGKATSSDSEPTWADQSKSVTTPSFTITLNKALAQSGATQLDTLNLDNSGNVLMMVPQTTPSDATLEVECTMTSTTDPSVTKTVTLLASLAGKEWLAGHTYTYTLSLLDFDYVFTHTDNIGQNGNNPTTDYTYTTDFDGKTFTDLDITSYKYSTDRNNNTTKTPLKWTASYQPFSGASWIPGLPNWAHFIDSSSNPVAAAAHDGTIEPGEAFSLTVDEFQYLNMDLSLYSLDKKARITRTTANSYFVTQPGTYRIPLVYGNGVKNGNVNNASYKVNDGFSSLLPYLSTFKNCRNGNISSVYIATDQSSYNLQNGTAAIVWQDVENLVTNPQLEWTNTEEDSYDGSTLGYLKFTVNPNNMNYGNSVLAVKDGSGTIVWSWHIWVNSPSHFLDYDNYGKSTERNGVIYTFAGSDMGWIDPASVTLDPREITVKLTQEESGLELYFTVHQDNLSFQSTYRNVFYQWGRKDPFPGNTPNNTNITVYNGSFSAVQNNSVALGTAIQNPGIQYVNTTGRYWQDDYRNLWNMNSTSTLSTTSFHGKTIYDPCPVGYRVPPSGAYQNFSITTATPVTEDGILYAQVAKHFYLPIVGYRDGEHDSGAHPVEWQRLAYYQQATALSVSESNMMRIRYYPVTDNIVGDDTHRGDQNRAMSLRPVKEPDSDVEIIENNPFSLKPDSGHRPEESLSKGNSNLW